MCTCRVNYDQILMPETMTILDAVPEGSEITVVQLRLAPLSFTH